MMQGWSWTRTAHLAKNLGLALGFFGFGAMAQSVVDQTDKLPALAAAAKALPEVATKLSQTENTLRAERLVKCRASGIDCAYVELGPR